MSISSRTSEVAMDGGFPESDAVMTMPTVSVLIPFFQREKGPLARAVESVLAQDYKGAVHVVVVDDGSPVSAADELSGLLRQRGSVDLIVHRQANGGPASARNTALNLCPRDTTLVAFLDSDDQWDHRHLTRAVRTLSRGFDFYFADHLQLGQQTGAFERAGRICDTAHPPLDGDATLRAFEGDMLDQIIRGNVIGTSTVVYRFDRFRDLRFLEEFTTAGEDYLFWMTLASKGARFCFSTACEAVYGKGVNVYSAAGWGTDGHMKRVQNELRYRLLTRKLFPLTGEQLRHISAAVRNLRLAFNADLLHRLRHGKPVDLALVGKMARVDPLTFAQLPRALFRTLVRHSRDEDAR